MALVLPDEVPDGDSADAPSRCADIEMELDSFMRSNSKFLLRTRLWESTQVS